MKGNSIRGNLARTLGVAAVVLLLFGALHAGRADEGSPAKALVAMSVKETGGVEKARGWTTRIDKGHLTAIWPGWGELHADYTRWVKKPGKMKIDQDFTAYDHPFFFTYYYNAGDVWAVVNLGARQNERYTRRMTRNMRTADGLAYYLAECDTFYLVTDAVDDSLFAVSAFDRVGIVDNGDTVLFDLDKKTHLPIRRIEERGSVQVLFGDYKETRAGKVAHRITVYQQGARTEEQVLDQVVLDEQIDDAIFDEFRPKTKE